MTGHGRGVAELAGRRATVEIRSVNHRFLDFKLRGAPLDAQLEDRLVALVRKHVERGSFTITIRDEGAFFAGAVRVDVEAARRVHAALEEVRRAIHSPEPVPLSLVVAQPGVLQIGDGVAEPDAVWAALRPAVEAALGELIEMRRREGEALAADLAERLDRLAAFSTEVAGLAAAQPEEWRRRLAERVERLVSVSSPAAQVDPARLAGEIAILADRLDVTEELVRIRSHLEQARALLGESGAVGRRLEFLVQELGREVNTIGSKSQSAEIARRVVDAKAELEKIREQVQNVE